MNFQQLHFYFLRFVLLIIAATSVLAQVVDLLDNASDPLKSAKVVVLIFVRTDCPISNRYAPELKRLAEKYKSEKMKFFLVYSGSEQTAELIKKHQAEFGLTLEAWRDPQLKFAKEFGVTVTPECIVWQQGKLMYRGRIDNRFVAFGKMRDVPTSHDLEDILEAVSHGKIVTKKITKAIGCFIS
jgi:thiol-disulfide isomerase/thioredoxin